MARNGHGFGLGPSENAAHGKLEALMSAMSQTVYATSWLANLEYMLWEALEKADPHPFTAQQLLELQALAAASDGWIRKDCGKSRCLSLEEWRRHHDQHKREVR